MRTITTTTNLYPFAELSDKAKGKARAWLREREAQDPPWLYEYRKSKRAALAFIQSFSRQDSLSALYAETEDLRADPAKSCPWTGYSMDEVAIDAILEAKNQGCAGLNQVCDRVEKSLAAAWDKEIEYTMSEENIDETLISNGYEFTELGRHPRLFV